MKIEKKYLIIADDFTGANDTGVQLRKRGHTVRVLLKRGGERCIGRGSLVLDTESRTMTESQAAKVIRNELNGVDFSQFYYVIKKVDSTLRGNIGSEVRALDEVFYPERIIFAPALPNLGRTTEDAIQKLNGVALCETELAKDPKNPVKEDHLVRLLKQVYEEPICHIGLKDLWAETFELGTERIFVFDATTNADLQQMIRLVKADNRSTLFIGTAGLVDNLLSVEEKNLPSFGAVASVSTVTNEQMHFCEEAGFTLVQFPIHRLLRKEVKPETYVEEVKRSLAEGNDTFLLPTASYDRAEIELSRKAGEESGMDMAEIGEYVRVMMGKMVREILLEVPVAGLFVTGGDTALGVLENLEAEGAWIMAEVLTGIPQVKVEGGLKDGLKMITKAGAFGQKDAIAFAMRKLKEAE